MAKSILIFNRALAISAFAGLAKHNKASLTFDIGAQYGAAVSLVKMDETGVSRLDDLIQSLAIGNTIGLTGNMVYRNVGIGIAYHRYFSSKSGRFSSSYWDEYTAWSSDNVDLSETVNFWGPYIKYISGNSKKPVRFNIGLGLGYTDHYLNLKQTFSYVDSYASEITMREGTALGTLILLGVQIKPTQHFGFDFMIRSLGADPRELVETTKSSIQTDLPKTITRSLTEYRIGFGEITAGLRYYF